MYVYAAIAFPNKCCLKVSLHGTKVLATAASNIAVDNLVERLAAADPKLALVRTGHAARLSALGAVLGCGGHGDARLCAHHW